LFKILPIKSLGCHNSNWNGKLVFLTNIFRHLRSFEEFHHPETEKVTKKRKKKEKKTEKESLKSNFLFLKEKMHLKKKLN
jgi:hypothetical protein